MKLSIVLIEWNEKPVETCVRAAGVCSAVPLVETGRTTVYAKRVSGTDSSSACVACVRACVSELEHVSTRVRRSRRVGQAVKIT